MGFEGKKVIKLKFEDSDLAGLEVVTRMPTVAQVMAISDAREALGDDAAPLEYLRPVAEGLVSVLVGWNLENDGEPVPHTVDAFLDQDYDVTQEIIRAWEEATFKVSVPLGEGSSSGEPSPEASIPMVALLPSQAS